MVQNGFSTGCLYKTGLRLLQIIDIYSKVGADAIELGFSNEQALENLELTPELATKLSRFQYVSVHAPWITKNYASYDQIGRKIFTRLERITGELPISGVVFHPDKFEDLSILEKTKLPVLIENMDIRKTIGINPDYFTDLMRRFNFGFVLDIQHAYEHDNTMTMAQEMIDAMGSGLKHLHVSGANRENPNHSLVYCADNRDEIVRTLAKTGNVPRIFEGVVTLPIVETAEKELNFMNSLFL